LPSILTLGLVEAWYDNEARIYLKEAPGFAVAQRDFAGFRCTFLITVRNFAALDDL